MAKKRLKVLFINAKRKTCVVSIPHLGLAMLAGVLKKARHEVLIVDYQLRHKAPSIEKFISEFGPDVIGLSMYTATTNECDELLDKVKNSGIPILVGGPHATFYDKELQEDNRIDYVCKGEFEDKIVEVVENAKKEPKVKVVEGSLPDLKKLPFPDFKAFYEYEKIRSYPMTTSRGCPYNCSFCPVYLISQRKWRTREPKDCIKELKKAGKEISPYLHVLIQDDNAIVGKRHIKEFLERFLRAGLEKTMRLAITNIRADSIEEELLGLLKKANCGSIGLGVEHGNAKVFEMIDKGESLEDIRKAARIVKNQGMQLSFCFVIGLPGDNLRRIKDSIKLANEFKTEGNYWNMVIPYKGTRVRDWFEKHGTLYNEIGLTSLTDGDFRCEEPCVETPDFSRNDRKKAHYMCLLETADERLKLRRVPLLVPHVIRHSLYGAFFRWLPNGVARSVGGKRELVRKGFKLYRREGFGQLVRQGREAIVRV